MTKFLHIYKVFLASLLLTLPLLNCNKSDTNSDPLAVPTSTVISGRITTSLALSGAIVRAYDYSSGLLGDLIATSEPSDVNGMYSLEINSFSPLIRLQTGGGNYQEWDERDSRDMNNTSLVANIQHTDGVDQIVNISAFTTFANGLAQCYLNNGDSIQSAVDQSNTTIASHFGVSSVLDFSPDTLSNPSATGIEPIDATRLGFFNAAMSLYVRSVKNNVSANPSGSNVISSALYISKISSDLSDCIFNGSAGSAKLTMGLLSLTQDSSRLELAKQLLAVEKSENNGSGVLQDSVLNMAIAYNNVDSSLFDGVAPSVFEHTPPTISNVNITNGQVVWKTISVDFDVIDIFGFGDVKVYVDGNLLSVGRPMLGMKTSVDTTAFADGNHTLTIKSTSRFNEVTSIDYAIIIANNSTGIFNIVPADGNYISSNVVVSADISDVVEVVKTTLLIDGQVRMTPANVLRVQFNLDTKTLSDGAHSITIQSTNITGFIKSETVNFIVDNTLPTGTLTVPTIFLETTAAVLNFNVADNLGLDKVEIKLGATLLTSLTDFSQTSLIIDSTQFADARYELTLTVFDKAGNVFTSIQNVYVDQAAPILTITYPLDGGTMIGDDGMVGETWDDNGFGLAEIRIDGNFYTYAGVSNNAVNHFVATSFYPNGQHILTMLVTDLAGRTTEKSVTVTFAN